MRAHCIALCLLGTIAWIAEPPPVRADPVTLAEIELGPVTTTDLWERIEYGPGLPGDDFDTEVSRDFVRRLLRECALEEITHHLLETGALGDRESILRCQIAHVEENARLQHARARLFPRLPSPSMEEIEAQIEAHPERHRLPDFATWRHMRFENEDQARTAVGRLRAGEDFETVAAEMASPPVSGTPGQLIGPALLEGRMFSEIEDALRTLPLDEPSDPIATPVGSVVLQVASRELDRTLTRESSIALAREEILQAREQARQEETMARFRERHPIVIEEDLSAESPDDAPALRVGEHVETLGDLRRRVLPLRDPDGALERLLSGPELQAMGEQLLVLVEAERLGLFDDPTISAYLAWQGRETARLLILSALREERSPQPTEEELRRFVEERSEGWETELFTVQALWITRATLAERTSGEIGLEHARFAEGVRQRLAEGEDAQAVFESVRSPDHQDELLIFEGCPAQRLPWFVANWAVQLEAGEVALAEPNAWGALLVRVSEQRHGLPALDHIREEAILAWRLEVHPDLSLEEDLLDEWGYRLLVDPARLGWGEGPDPITVLSLD